MFCSAWTLVLSGPGPVLLSVQNPLSLQACQVLVCPIQQRTVEHWDLGQGRLPEGNFLGLYPYPTRDRVPAPGRSRVPSFLTFPEDVLLPLPVYEFSWFITVSAFVPTILPVPSCMFPQAGALKNLLNEEMTPTTRTLPPKRFSGKDGISGHVSLEFEGGAGWR